MAWFSLYQKWCWVRRRRTYRSRLPQPQVAPGPPPDARAIPGHPRLDRPRTLALWAPVQVDPSTCTPRCGEAARPPAAVCRRGPNAWHAKWIRGSAAAARRQAVAANNSTTGDGGRTWRVACDEGVARCDAVFAAGASETFTFGSRCGGAGAARERPPPPPPPMQYGDNQRAGSSMSEMGSTVRTVFVHGP